MRSPSESTRKLQREIERQSAEVSRILTVTKFPEIRCPDCKGSLTFGLLMDCPLVWHSEPWCREFSRMTERPEVVVQLARRASGLGREGESRQLTADSPEGKSR